MVQQIPLPRSVRGIAANGDAERDDAPIEPGRRSHSRRHHQLAKTLAWQAKNGNDTMNGYYRPQEILVLEAELARAKAMLAAQGATPDLLDVNTPLLAELVIKAKSQISPMSQPAGDVASMAASQFRRMMLGLEAADTADFSSGSDLTAA